MNSTLKRSFALAIVVAMFFNMVFVSNANAGVEKSTGMDINLNLYEYDGKTVGAKMDNNDVRVGQTLLAKIEFTGVPSFAVKGIVALTQALDYDPEYIQNLLIPANFSSDMYVNDIKSTVFGSQINSKLANNIYNLRASDTKFTGNRRIFTTTYVYDSSVYNESSVFNEDGTTFVMPIYIKKQPPTKKTIISITKDIPKLQATTVRDIVDGKIVTSNHLGDSITGDITIGERELVIEDFTGAIPENITDTNPLTGNRTITVANLKGLTNVPAGTVIKVYDPTGTILLGEATAATDGSVTVSLNRTLDDKFNANLNLGGILKITATQPTFPESDPASHLVDKRPNKITKDVNVGTIGDVYQFGNLDHIDLNVTGVPVTYHPVTGLESGNPKADMPVEKWDWNKGESSDEVGFGKFVSGRLNPSLNNIINPDDKKATGLVDVKLVDSFDAIEPIEISADDSRNTRESIPKIGPTTIVANIAGGKKTDVSGVTWTYKEKDIPFVPKGTTYQLESNVVDSSGRKATVDIKVTPVKGTMPFIPEVVEIEAGTSIETFDDLLKYLVQTINADLTGQLPATIARLDLTYTPNTLPEDFDTKKVGKEWIFTAKADFSVYPWVTWSGTDKSDVAVRIVKHGKPEIIISKDKEEITQGDNLFPKDYIVSAIDPAIGDVRDKVVIESLPEGLISEDGKFDTSKTGLYDINYSYDDGYGNVAKKTLEVTIINPNTGGITGEGGNGGGTNTKIPMTGDQSAIALIIVFLVSGALGIVVFSKKNKKLSQDKKLSK